MRIYTRAGDAGETSLANGERVSKADPRVEAFGTIDEASCAIALAVSALPAGTIRDALIFCQQRLYNCASYSATPPYARSERTSGVTPDDLAFLERVIDLLMEQSGPLDAFVLPGGSEAAARLQAARAVVRRAERRVVALDLALEDVIDVARFLNRLSDLLFAAARATVTTEGVSETTWDPAAPLPDLRT